MQSAERIGHRAERRAHRAEGRAMGGGQSNGRRAEQWAEGTASLGFVLIGGAGGMKYLFWQGA